MTLKTLEQISEDAGKIYTRRKEGPGGPIWQSGKTAEQVELKEVWTQISELQ